MVAKRNTISMVAIRHALMLSRGGHTTSTDAGLVDLWNQLPPQTQLEYLQEAAGDLQTAIAAYQAELAAAPVVEAPPPETPMEAALDQAPAVNGAPVAEAPPEAVLEVDPEVATSNTALPADSAPMPPKKS